MIEVNKNDFLWVEKYRPKTVGECILPARLKAPFQACVDAKEIQTMILSGSAGVGKTTIAKAMCEEIGCDYLFINGSSENGIDTFRTKIVQYAGSLSMDGGRKVIIIDEADYLNPNSVQPALRSAIEEFSRNCTFLFTCNYPARLIPPLRSRGPNIDFTLQADEKKGMALEFYRRVGDILISEAVDADMKVVAKLIEKYFPDFRRVIGELQFYAKTNNKIDSGVLSSIKEVDLQDLIKHMKARSFADVRKWAATASADPATVYGRLYNVLYGELTPTTIPTAIIKCGDYAYKSAFVSDQELNLTACLAEIMLECEFK
jgi:DNA polymerase III delta prime subunit